VVVQQLLSRAIIVERSTIIWDWNKAMVLVLAGRIGFVEVSLYIGIVPKYVVHKVGKGRR
jgi:hypothetical protein